MVMLSLAGCQEGSNNFSTEPIGEAEETSTVQITGSVTGVDLDVKA